MKNLVLTLILLLCLSAVSNAQGTSCNTAIALTLDGVCRDYTISSSVDDHALCPGTGDHPVTFFRFTTNASADPVLLDINAPGSTQAEIAFYTGCGASNPQGFQSQSSMCFTDGEGLWAPAETFTLAANTTYYIRILTTVTGTISICGRNNVPTNNTCAGARTIGTTPISDHNANHKPWYDGTPAWLCAWTLENTAFYEYTVQSTGISTVSIENIACDNRNTGSDVGFQIGFFTGTCASLVPESCSEGAGSIVVATNNSLAAGTRVTVAIDGILGANCSYNIRATNAVLLSVKWKHFTGWKDGNKNRLRWSTSQEVNNDFFEIQRSLDGVTFSTIGKVDGSRNSNELKEYKFEDADASGTLFYRIRQVSTDGNENFSNVIKLKGDLQQRFTYYNTGSRLTYNLQLQEASQLNLQVVDALGRSFLKSNKNLAAGDHTGDIDISTIPHGMYYLLVSDRQSRKSYSFRK